MQQVKGADKVKELVDFALSNRTEENQEVKLGTIANYKAQAINAATGVIVRGGVPVLTSSGVRHSIDGHGDHVKEAQRGQVGVTEKDFLLLADIIENADSYEKGNKNRKREESVLFIKKIQSHTYYVAMSIVKSKDSVKLVFNTMYIKK